jgi:hypothetical protein
MIPMTARMAIALQRPVEPVGPAVIRTAELTGNPFCTRDDRRRMMTADVEEPAQLIIGTAHDDERFARHLQRHELPLPGHLRGAADRHPCTREHRLRLQPQHAGVGVPGRRTRERLGKRQLRAVRHEELVE